MPQTKTMTLDEKLAISNKAAALWNTGDKEGDSCLTRSISMPPYLTKDNERKNGG